MATNQPINRICSFPECGKPLRSRGLCTGHYKQHKKGAILKAIIPRQTPEGACSFPGCERDCATLGLCQCHYEQQWRGFPLTAIRYQRPKKSPPEIAWDEAPCPNPELAGPCHIFRGHKGRNGYGRVTINRKGVFVHRYIWEQANGTIPDSLVIDHQCRNKACCNLNHLRLVTHRVNVLENSIGPAAINAAKTHCKRGHPFNKRNTYFAKGGGRCCRICNAQHQINYKTRMADKRAVAN